MASYNTLANAQRNKFLGIIMGGSRACWRRGQINSRSLKLQAQPPETNGVFTNLRPYTINGEDNKFTTGKQMSGQFSTFIISTELGGSASLDPLKFARGKNKLGGSASLDPLKSAYVEMNAHVYTYNSSYTWHFRFNLYCQHIAT